MRNLISFIQFEQKNYRQLKRDKIFYIDIRPCNKEQLRKLLEHFLSQGVELFFNGAHNIEDFINREDQSGYAWAWSISIEISYVKISGIHTKGWGLPENNKKMITCEDAYSHKLTDINEFIDKRNSKNKFRL